MYDNVLLLFTFCRPVSLCHRARGPFSRRSGDRRRTQNNTDNWLNTNKKNNVDGCRFGRLIVSRILYYTYTLLYWIDPTRMIILYAGIIVICPVAFFSRINIICVRYLRIMRQFKHSTEGSEDRRGFRRSQNGRPAKIKHYYCDECDWNGNCAQTECLRCLRGVIFAFSR